MISWPVSGKDRAGTDLSITCNVDGTTITPVTDPSYDPQTETLSAEFAYPFPVVVGGTSVTCTVTDQGDNYTTSDPFWVTVEDRPVIDASSLPTPPVIVEANSGDPDFAYIGDVGSLWTVTASDGIDGPGSITAVCSPDDPSGNLAYGDNTITCTATDSKGNVSDPVTFTATVVYSIRFELPKGRLKAGSVLPVDFWYEHNGERIDASGIGPSASWFGPIDAQGCPAEAGSSPGTGEDAGSSQFRWEALEKLWQFNWQTPSKIGLYQFTISPPGTSDSSIPVCLK